jgi:hypothetical protein
MLSLSKHISAVLAAIPFDKLRVSGVMVLA